ncbi:MAG: MBL fold metallo-hydrolase, partial [Acidobacteria bacterium]|nr:MBL fold metallo-hydrolase [Acidobacteriota bacterium]
MKIQARIRTALFALVFIAAAPKSLDSVHASPPPAAADSAAQIHSLKVTVLSTMLVGQPAGIGEWGFAALVEADGHRILLDTGTHPDTVALNLKDLKLDLSGVHEVVLSHSHWDHVGGLLALRRELMKKDPAALSVVHVSKGIFYSRPGPQGE